MPHNEADGEARPAHTPAMIHVPTREVATQTNDAARHALETTARITPRCHACGHSGNDAALAFAIIRAHPPLVPPLHHADANGTNDVVPTLATIHVPSSTAPSPQLLASAPSAMTGTCSGQPYTHTHDAEDRAPTAQDHGQPHAMCDAATVQPSQPDPVSASSPLAAAPDTTQAPAAVANPAPQPQQSLPPVSLSSVCGTQSPVPWLVAAMPLRQSKRAPKLFEGEDEEIAEFLEAYEHCADDARQSNNERVNVIFRYLHRSQELIIMAFRGYAMEDWDVFKASIKEAFGCKD
ncbi:hypothetical protein JB92DRAFT_2826792 [Gautieria morchelliformis]|nr:hypothetical protein JB92DRAFT_2826792 [Gautieria morchelliformis]